MNKGYQNFKKRAGQLAIALTLAGTTAIGANAATVTGVTKANVNMRSGAGTKYKVVKVVKANKTVTILGQKGSWYKVKYNGKTGYISKSYVIKKNYTVKKYSGKYKTKVALTVRKGPGTNYVKAGTLKKGEVVTVKGKTSNGWLQITYKGATRYISGSSKYVVKYTAPVKNNAPVINVEDTYTLTKGEDFEYAMLNATATDKEDGDLTDKIDFSGVVNTGKVGEYTVKLEVKDSKGATATKSVKVVVEDVKTNNKPVIAVNSTYEVKQNGSFNYADLKASAFDEEDGKLDIVYTGKVDTKTLGEYKVILTATDKDGNTTKKVVTVIVARNSKPTIDCKDTVEILKGTKFDYSLLNAKATDKEDGDITSKIKVLYFDEVNTNKVGDYKVTFQVTDSNKKGATEVATVKVVENKGPEITVAKDTITLNQNDKFDVSMIGATAKDIHAVTGKETPCEIEYKNLVDTNTPGEYSVILTAKDAKGATSTKTVKVIVKAYKDNEKPVINVSTNQILVKLGSTLDEATLKSMLKAEATDKEDGNLTSEIKVKGLDDVDTKALGETFKVTLSVTDSQGAVATEEISIVIVK